MKAAVLTQLNAPLELAEVEPWAGSLGYGQVMVKVTQAGICGAQLQEIRGEKGGPLPHLLGHEGVGIVQEIGPAVNKVKSGDKVVLHWRKGDGIESDFPKYNFESQWIASGKVTTFSEFSIVSENRLTPVPSDTPDDLCALLGCSLSTALGVVENEANIRFGESVLIVGCGGLGVNLIVSAKIRGAIVGVIDPIESKREIAERLGAFFGIKCSDEVRPNCIIETSGSASAIESTLPLLADGGRYIMVGQPKPHMNVKILNANHLFGGTGKSIKATQGGCFNPSVDIPRYVNLWRSGALKLDGIITHRFSLNDINQGLDVVRSGQAGRVMIQMFPMATTEMLI